MGDDDIEVGEIGGTGAVVGDAQGTAGDGHIHMPPSGIEPVLE